MIPSLLTKQDVMYYLKAQYPPKFIRDSFNLTDEQISAVLSYGDMIPGFGIDTNIFCGLKSSLRTLFIGEFT